MTLNFTQTLLILVNYTYTSFLHTDSAAPSLKSKTKQLAASSSSPTTTEISTCGATTPVQTEPPSSSPAPSPPAPTPPEPAQEEMASADTDAPQAEDSNAQEIKNDRAESEVSHL